MRLKFKLMNWYYWELKKKINIKYNIKIKAHNKI